MHSHEIYWQLIIFFCLQNNNRRKVFADNLRKIEKHNAEAASGLHSYTMGINKFADMTNEEFLSKFTSSQKTTKKGMSERKYDSSQITYNETDLPQEVDWRKEVKYCSAIFK